MANHLLEKMFEREVQTKKADYEEMKAALKDATVLREESQDELERAKRIWEDKTQETDKKIEIREKQIQNKLQQSESLRAEITKLQKMLEEADGKLKQH